MHLAPLENRISFGPTSFLVLRHLLLHWRVSVVAKARDADFEKARASLRAQVISIIPEVGSALVEFDFLGELSA